LQEEGGNSVGYAVRPRVLRRGTVTGEYFNVCQVRNQSLEKCGYVI